MSRTQDVFSICPARIIVSVRHIGRLSNDKLITLVIVIGYSDNGGSNQKVSNLYPVYP